jgi:hypothetical protein
MVDAISLHELAGRTENIALPRTDQGDCVAGNMAFTFLVKRLAFAKSIQVDNGNRSRSFP